MFYGDRSNEQRPEDGINFGNQAIFIRKSSQDILRISGKGIDRNEADRGSKIIDPSNLKFLFY